MTLIKIYYQCTEEKLPLAQLDFHPELLEILEEMGIVNITDECINTGDLRRLNKVMRLRSFLGVNLTGAAIITELLERIEKLEEEVEYLKRMR